MTMNQFADTEDRCHCGASYEGCDHCSVCGCEQYETERVETCHEVQRHWDRIDREQHRALVGLGIG